MLIEYRSSRGHALEIAGNGRLMPVETRVEDIRANLESRGCPADLIDRVCAAQRRRDVSTLSLDEIKARAEELGKQIKAEATADRASTMRDAARAMGHVCD